MSHNFTPPPPLKNPNSSTLSNTSSLSAFQTTPINHAGSTGIKSPPNGDSPALSPSPSQYRPIIHTITLHNFKSYYGTQTLGPFDPHLTSIVGSNGNGKSNAIDAIQFVFGKRGKQMRAKKVRELVWQGEKNLEARVEIVFRFVQQSDGNGGNSTSATHPQYQIDEKTQKIRELRIARAIPAATGNSASGNTTSKYYINSRTATYNAIQDELQALGIDLCNDRFLILQGEVEAISLMKPLDYLQYLNGIIGTERFAEPIKEAQQKLEQINQERDLQYDRLRLSEAAVDALEGPTKEAQSMIRKKIQKNEIKYKLRLLNYEKSTNNIRLCDKDIHATQAQKQKITAQIDRENDKYRNEELKYYELKDKYSELSGVLDKCKAKVHRYENNRAHLEQEIKNVTSRLQRLRKKLQNQKASAGLDDAMTDDDNSLDTTQDTFQQRIKQCESKHAALTKELRDVEMHLHQSRNSLQALQSEHQKELLPISKKMEEIRQKMLPFSERIDKLEKKIQVKTNLIEMIRQQEQNQQSDVAQIEEKHAQTNTELQQARKELEEHTQSLTDLREQLEEARRARNAAIQKYADTEKEKHEQLLRVAELEQTAKQFSAFNTVYDELMECKQKQTIRGICDKLANCGTVDEKYTTALYAACHHMNYIVTDTTESATSCVKHLQKYSVGVGKFMMLDKMEHLREKIRRNVSQLPRGATRLFDLIQFKDNKFHTAFYFAIKDTLVARDMTEARELAFNQKKRHRVVTLAGEMIETSGIMSSSPNLKQVMMMTTISSDLQSEKSKMDDISQQFQGLMQEKKDLDKRVDTLERQYSEARIENEKLNIKVRQLTKSLMSIHNASTMLNQTLNDTMLQTKDQTPQQIEADVKQLQEQLAATREEVSVFEEELAKLQVQQDSIGGSHMLQIKTKITLLEKQLEETKAKIAKSTVKKNQLEKQMEKYTEESKKTTAQKLELETQLSKLCKELDELTSTGGEIQQAFDTAELNKTTMENELTVYADKHEEYRDKMDFLRRQEHEFLMDEKNFCEKRVEYEKQQSYWKKDMDKTLRAIEKDWEILSIFNIDLEQQEGANQDDDAMEDIQEEGVAPLRRLTEAQECIQALRAAKSDTFNEEELSTEFQTLEAQLYQQQEKTTGLKALINEYQEKKTAYMQQYASFMQVTEQRNTTQALFDKLRKERLEEFMDGFTKISLKLKEIYQMITMGGDAELELVDRHDPFKAGIVFSVKPPRKSWRKIQNLSGGEKTLSSLALIFALHHFKPTPIYIMDEIDAALDVRNVAIVGHYIKQRTKNAQFAVISLRNAMFELADRLVGIFKVDNKTRCVTVQPSVIVQQVRKGVQNEDESAAKIRVALQPVQGNVSVV